MAEKKQINDLNTADSTQVASSFFVIEYLVDGTYVTKKLSYNTLLSELGPVKKSWTLSGTNLDSSTNKIVDEESIMTTSVTDATVKDSSLLVKGTTLWRWFLWVLTQAITFSARITFLTTPRIDAIKATTVDEVVEIDSNGDLKSVTKNAAYNIGVDDSTIEVSGGNLQLKDSGITTAKIGDAQVTNVKMVGGAAGTIKYSTGSGVGDLALASNTLPVGNGSNVIAATIQNGDMTGALNGTDLEITIDANAVQFSQITAITTDKILGNVSGGDANISELSASDVKTLLGLDGASYTDNSGATGDGTLAAYTADNESVTYTTLDERYVYYPDIAAATTTLAITQINISGGGATFSAVGIVQPDVPRNVIITVTDADNSVSAFDITINGTDMSGDAVSEVLSFASALVIEGNQVFASITSVECTNFAGNGAGDAVDMGYQNKIGLPNANHGGLAIVKLVSGGTTEAASAYNEDYGYFTPTTAPNGTNDYEVWYVTYTDDTNLNELRIAYENLRAMTEDLLAFNAKLIDDFQA